MNYMAHAFLSPSDPLVLLGNIACDMIRPDAVHMLPELVKTGMAVHQQIDRSTDRHIGFKTARDLLNSKKLPYAGVLTDIIFDHYLAGNWHYYSRKSLSEFSASVYEILIKSNAEHTIPGHFHHLAAALVRDNWFVSYSTEQGLEEALSRLNYRSSREIPVSQIMDTVKSDTDILYRGFKGLMSDLMQEFPHSQ